MIREFDLMEEVGNVYFNKSNCFEGLHSSWGWDIKLPAQNG